MRIASSTSQNCGISYFIFDDLASLAGSADAQNVDPLILSDICEGLKNENPYCTDLRFLGVEARARAEGITVIPRMGMNAPPSRAISMVMAVRRCNTERIGRCIMTRVLPEATGCCHWATTRSVSPRRPPGQQSTQQ